MAMTRAILIPFHKYTPFGDEFYEPILDFFLQQMEKYQDEFDKIYFIDSNWNIDVCEVVKKLPIPEFKIIKANPHLRYYDAYKEVLPQVKEDLVLLMDNDMVVYRKGMIKKTFELLTPSYDMDNFKIEVADVVSIIDQIGTMKVSLKTGNKFCPYWFATKKETLMKYIDVDWSPDMPYTETLGHLTEAMLKNGLRPYEWEEDKGSIYLGDSGGILESPSPGKNLGYYHIRAGSTPATLLAWENSPEHRHSYKEYIENQPKQEILRQCAWYEYMGGNPERIVIDCNQPLVNWHNYMEKFIEYHGL